jgi:hypothetical protein
LARPSAKSANRQGIGDICGAVASADDDTGSDKSGGKGKAKKAKSGDGSSLMDKLSGFKSLLPKKKAAVEKPAEEVAG